jgi:hypothetical protein
MLPSPDGGNRAVLHHAGLIAVDIIEIEILEMIDLTSGRGKRATEAAA